MDSVTVRGLLLLKIYFNKSSGNMPLTQNESIKLFRHAGQQMFFTEKKFTVDVAVRSSSG